MGYLLFSISAVMLILSTAFYLTRNRWLPYVRSSSIPGASYIYSRLPDSFSGDIEAGLSSSTFDLAGNVQAGDSRAGLDNAAKKEILAIMKSRRMNFDQARQVYTENTFKANGIGPDGRPRDPKFVSFS